MAPSTARSYRTRRSACAASAASTASSPAAVRAAASSGAGSECRRNAANGCSSARRPSSAAVAAQSGPSPSRSSARSWLQSEMQLREVGDRVDLVRRGDPNEAVRVEVVAEEERRVVVGRLEEARPAVVDEVALVDRLEAERVLRRAERGEDGGAIRLRERGSRPRGCSPPPRRRRSRPRGQPWKPRDGGDRALDLLVAVRGRREERLELRRREVDALLEQVTEQRAVALGVARLRVVEVAHRRVGHEEREQRADALDAAERSESLLEAARRALELVVDGAVAQAAEDGEARGDRERVPRERARLVDGADRREQIHELGAPAERGERQPAADDLAEHGQVRRDAEPLLRAAARDAEAGDHLVEDEQRAARVAQAAQRLEEARRGRDDAHVRRDRLDDHRRDPLAVLDERLRRGVEVVVRDDDRVGRRAASARRATPGMPSVARPEPALASSASAWPW